MKKLKKLTTIFLMALCMGCSISAFAQTPPPPPADPGSGGGAVGGGAPIGGGLGILLALGAAYGIKKVYQFNKNENE